MAKKVTPKKGKKSVRQETLADLIPDDKNFNKHSQYGTFLLEKSLTKLGAGRSILIDKNNKIIAGNATVEGAAAIGIENIQIVDSDGTKIIAVRRTDIDLDTAKGRELALADNVVAKANIIMDAEAVYANVETVIAEEWGVKQEEKFEPNVNPETGRQLVSKEDIEKRNAELLNKFNKEQAPKLQVICPNCTHEFDIDK